MSEKNKSRMTSPNHGEIDNNSEEILLERVLLLALYRKSSNNSINDMLVELAEIGAFKNIKEAKQTLKNLRDKKLIENGLLTQQGLEQVQEALKFFGAN